MKTARYVYLIIGSPLAAFLLAAIPASADVELSTQSVTAKAGSTNDFFEVLLTNTGTTAVDLGAFAFEIGISNPAVTFTESTTTSKSAPYVFAGNSFADSFAGGVTSTSAPGQVLDASDLALAPNSGANLTPGNTVDLGTVYFDISPGAARGVTPIAFNTNQAVTNLSDPNGVSIGIDSFNPGDLDVTVTPEPPMLILIGALLLFIVVGSWKRVKAAAGREAACDHQLPAAPL